MKCSLNSPIFGVGIPPNLNLGLGVAVNAGESMERIVNGDVSVQMSYRPHHEQFSQQLFNEAGGEERYADYQLKVFILDLHLTHSACSTPLRLFIQHKLYFAYIKHLWATDRKDEAMTRLGLLCKVVGMCIFICCMFANTFMSYFLLTGNFIGCRLDITSW